MKKAFAVLGMVLGLTALPSQAEILDINIGNNSFRGAFAGPLSRLLPGTTGQYDAGVVVRPRTSDDLLQVHGGLLLTGDAGAKDIDLAAGLGGRVLYIGRDHDKGGALALGGQLEGRLPSYNRFGLTASTYYAPGITTFGQLDRYWENTLALDYELIRGGNVYVGYRNIRAELGGAGESTIDNGFNLGFRLKF